MGTFAGCPLRNQKSLTKGLTQLFTGQVNIQPAMQRTTTFSFANFNHHIACPQYVTDTWSFWNAYEPPNLLVNIGEKLDQGSTAWSSAEDCLSMAVWTPAYANKTSKLPVSLFVTGGGGITGAIQIPSQLPAHWVSRSQEHITITINYRANIFGSETPCSKFSPWQ